MTIDRSLKRKGRLVRSRNVLKRAERVAQMKSQDTWKEGQAVLGLPKTRVIKAQVGKKKKAAKTEEAAGAAPAKGAAAPAKGAAKAAAPAKK